MISDLNHIQSNLEALSNILSIELPKGVHYLKIEISKQFSLNQFNYACKVIKNWSKRHFPMLGDFKEALKERIEVTDHKQKYEKWQIEYAEKLNISIERFVNLKASDLTKEQRKLIGVLEPEERTKLFDDIYKQIQGIKTKFI